MKKLILTATLLLILLVGFSQKPLSIAAVKDFSSSAFYYYRYGKNGTATAYFNTMLSRKYQFSDIAVIMETLETNKEGREFLFEQMRRQFGDGEYLFRQLYSLGIKAVHCKEIVNYVAAKGSVEVPPVVQIDSVKKSFVIYQGTRRFADETNTYVREVTIQGNEISIKLYAGKNNGETKDTTKLFATETGYIRNGKIFIKQGKDYTSGTYRIEKGELIIAKDQGD